MKMNCGYGGSQREMHPTNTKQEFDYLGPYERILEEVGEKHVLFQERSGVPFWMTPQERVATKFSQYDEL